MTSDARELTQAQLGIWLAQQRAADPALFNAAEYVLLEGALDVPAFEAALARTLGEAQALNVAFVEERGVPRVVPVRFAGARLEIVQRPDLAGEEALSAHVEALAREPLALESGRPWRHQLVVVGPRTWAWVHVAHHVALDGFGFQLIGRRVSQWYEAIRRGAEPSGPGFTDLERVLDEERAYVAGDQEADRAFWARELGARVGLPLAAASELLGEAAGGIGRGRRSSYFVDAELTRALEVEAARAGVSWAEVAIALVGEHLAALQRTRSLVLGLPVSLRLGRAALRTPCMAMNIAPLPLDLDGVSSLTELARAAKAALQRQRRHQRYRHEQLRRDRARIGRPFGPIINLLPFDEPARFGDVTARVVRVVAGPVEDLAVTLAPRAQGLALTIDRHAELHPAAVSDAFAAAITDGLAAWIENPARALRLPPPAISPAPPAAIAPAPSEAPAPVWPPEAIARHAAERPEAIALCHDGRAWSYAELHAQACAFAAGLQARGTEPGDLVAVEARRSDRAIVALLGVLYAGAGYVFLDPTHPIARRRAVMAQSRPRLLVREDLGGEPLGDALEIALDSPPPRSGGGRGRGTGERSTERARGPLPLRGDSLAYVVFTSGSSGEPKGVAVSARALASFLGGALAVYRWSPSDRVLQFAPLTFDASVEEIFGTLAAGATLVVRDDGWLDSPEGFLAACARERLTVLDLPTAYWHELALAVAERALPLPPSLASVLIGGEAASPSRVQAWKARAPGVRLLNTYGPTEATVVALTAELDGAGPEVPIGRPLPGVRALVCDPSGDLAGDLARDLAGAPAGRAGELWLAGPTLADGYLGSDERTAARFVELPGVGRAYRTGDLVETLADGQLVYRGRVDDEVKVSGHRVAPAEVEAVLLRHPQVVHAVVWGEATAAGHKLCARVEAGAVTAPELRAFVAGALPAALVPTLLEVHAALPRTASGKLDRGAVKALARHEATSAALTPSQAKVAALFGQVLGTAAVGLDDDFFALGGDSLGIIQLANRLSAAGSEVRVAEIFRRPTPRALAAWLEAPSSAPPVFQPREIELPAPLVLGRPSPEAASRILLTGATGLVGVHLLAALLERFPGTVACVVRAGSDVAAMARLGAAAERFGVELSRVRQRLEIVLADLGAPGLAADLGARVSPCATVVHAAAQVSLTRDYASLAAVNVAATAELLTLAGRWGAAFHQISSIAVAPAAGPDAPEVAEAFVAAHEGLADGYQQSKWHAEALCETAWARGLEVAVHRLGRVSGSRRAPFVVASDLVWRVARAAVRAGAWPDLAVEEPWIPADEAARAVAELVGARATGVFHLTHAGTVSLARVAEALRAAGFPLATLPLPAWLERVRATADDEDRATLAFFERPAPARAARFASTRTRGLVAALPAGVDEALLAAYARAFRDSLSHPATPPAPADVFVQPVL